MKTRNEMMRLSVLALAIQSALGVMCLLPANALADDDVATLVNPTNTVSFGAKSVSETSSKFGEYNGLTQLGTYGLLDFNVRGGDSYGQGTGLTRWSLLGDSLGSKSGSAQATYSRQGQWSVGLGYDQLEHDITNTFQSPFTGTMGGNSFTLPTSFGVINTTALTGSASQLVGTRNLTPAQLAAFQTFDVNTQRNTSSLTAGLTLSPHWNVQFEFNHLQQNGAKLIGAASSGAYTPAAWSKEAPVTLMNPTNYRTDTLNLSASWQDADSFMTAAYYMSFFRNADNMLFWNNPMVGGNATTGAPLTTSAFGYQGNALSVMPDNSFTQLNLTGGTRLSPTMRLAGGFSYGINTQDTGYLIDPSVLQGGAAGSPQTSLGGNVVNTHADLKLTDQYSKDLTLTAGAKYNQRLNNTGSAVYKMFDLGGGAGTAYQGPGASSTARTEINTPYSYTKTNLELAGDFRLSPHNNMRVSYEHEDLSRFCKNIAGASAPLLLNQTGNVASPAGANCVVVTGSSEDRYGINFRGKAGDSVNYNLGYTYGLRQSNYDHNALTPLNDSAGSNGTGLVNASDYKGYLAAFEASRTQSVIKAGINWQQNDRLSYGVSGRYTSDQYPDSTLGIQTGQSWGVNFDAAYSYSDTGVLTGYVSSQARNRILLSGANGTDNSVSYATMVAPTNLWRNVLNDSDLSLGLNLKQKGLMGGKLELNGDVSLSIGESYYNTQIFYSPNSGTCALSTSLTCGNTPTISNNTFVFKLTGTYEVDKKSKVLVGYQYQQLVSSDYYYNGLQYGYTPSTVLSTNQQPPDYTVMAVSVAYIYSF